MKALSSVNTLISFAERLGDATSLDPLTWCPRSDADGTLYTADGEAGATRAEVASAWEWLLSDQRHRELADLHNTGVYITGGLVDLLADDGTEMTTAPIRDLDPADAVRAAASLLVTIAALRRRLHEAGAALTTLIGEHTDPHPDDVADDEDDL